MDIWVWIAIFIAVWLLEALAGAAKKKRQREELQQGASRPRRGPGSPPPLRRMPPAPPRPRQAPRTVSGPAQQSTPPITVQAPVVHPPVERTAARVAPVEGVSAEVDVVEPAAESTDASHTRVTEKYRGPAPGEIGSAEPERRGARFVLRPRTAREAIVWMEILGPPKGLRG